MTASALPERTDLDRRIWEEELDGFVPARIFDAHTHLYRWEHYRAPDKDVGPLRTLLGETWAEATWELADRVDALLFPGRTIQRLSFPFPFPHPCDFGGANAFLADQLGPHPESAGLLLVHPGLSADEAEAAIDRHGFLGFKPYRFYASSGDPVGCGITDFLPEHQLAVADRRGLLVMMHLSKPDAVADPDNRRELRRLCGRYPGVRWILAHCARSYSAWPIEAAASDMRDLPNVWYDTSSVCESDAFEALYRLVGVERVLYGSDDIPIGVLRGKYVTFGRAWAYLSETNHHLGLSHCDRRMTFTRYEQLRAMRRASLRLGHTPEQIQALFHGTAMQLVDEVRQRLGGPGGA